MVAGRGSTVARSLPGPNVVADASRRASSAGLVLRAVLDRGPLSRSAIARATGLSPASVTSRAGELLSCGLLLELSQETAANGMGRPFVPLDVNVSVGVVGGIHFAVEYATVAVLDIRGKVLGATKLLHDGASSEVIVNRSTEALDAILATHAGRRPLLGVGVASGGWVDRSSGTIVEHGMLGWRQVSVAEPFQRRFGVPVIADSHARSLIRAEQLFGDPRSRASTLALFVGNVVEAAFAMGEQVNYGPRSRAGAVAHLPVVLGGQACGCGRSGCLEATVSDRRLVRRAAEVGIPTRHYIDDVVAAAVAGNAVARELFRERAEVVGRAIAPIVDLLSPELVLIVDPGVAYLPECLAALQEHLAANSVMIGDPAQTVVVSRFSDTVLETAGGAAVLDALYTNPGAVMPVSSAS